MKKILTLFLAFIICLSAIGCGDQGSDDDLLFYAKYDANNTADLEIDFGSQDGSVVANLQKYDMFSPTWGYIDGKGGLKDDALDALKYLDPLKVESYRIDFMAGGSGIGATPELSAGNWDNPELTLKNVYKFYDEIVKYDVMPYYILVGNPKYVWGVEEDGSARTPNMEMYKNYLENLSRSFKESGRRVTFETWNEPDLGTTYWQSGMKAFLDMNVEGALALKRGDPDALVVEVASCWPIDFCEYLPVLGSSLWDYYMEINNEKGNKVDAFSWHYYGGYKGDMEGVSTAKNFSSFKSAIRDKINRDNAAFDLYTMTQHITEYAPTDNSVDSLVLTAGLVPKLMQAIEYGLEATDVSRISWCSYYMSSDNDYGGDYNLINYKDNSKRPIYYLFWAYSRMPQLQAKTNFANEELKDTFMVRTGVDGKRASAIITNKTLNKYYSAYYGGEAYEQNIEDSRTVNVKVKNIPFTAKSLKVHLIDNETTQNTIEATEPYKVLSLGEKEIKSGDVVLSLKIPGNSAFYIEFDDGSNLAETDVESNLADKIVRKDYYYEERADLMPYSDIYEDGFNVTMGMLNNQSGSTAVSVVIDKANEYALLETDWQIVGNPAGENGSLGVRVDYHTANGYVGAEDYYYGTCSNGFFYSGWGTGEKASVSTKMSSSVKFAYNLPLSEKAPSGWDGRIKLTFYMANAGINTAANVRVCGK